MSIIKRRPGVYSQYSITSLCPKGFSQKACAIIAKTKLQNCGEVLSIRNLQNAKEIITDNEESLVCAQIILKSGVSKIYYCTYNDELSMEKVLDKLKDIQDIGVLTIGEVTQSYAQKIKEHVERCSAMKKERIAVIGNPNYSQAITLSQKLQSERIVICTGEGYEINSTVPSNFYVVASFIGKILTLSEPCENISLAVMENICGLKENLTDDEVELCIEKGVTCFEDVGSNVQCIKALTTKTKTNGVEDKTFCCVNTVLEIDYIMQSLRNMLSEMLRDRKTNSFTIDSISSQISIMLSEFLDMGVINSFEIPKVYIDGNDKSVCIVEINIQLTSVIDTIHLVAHIIV